MNETIQTREDEFDNLDDGNSGNSSHVYYTKMTCFPKAILLASLLCIILVTLNPVENLVDNQKRKLQKYEGSVDLVSLSDSSKKSKPFSDLGRATVLNLFPESLPENKKLRSFGSQRNSKFNKIELKKYKSVPTFANKCKRWGVVTTISNPTKAVARLATMSSWCLVIVPDLETPDDYMDRLAEFKISGEEELSPELLKNVFYFSIEKQREWERAEGPFGFFVRSIPWNHYSRKNIGYLFAITHGAEYIFDFDDDTYIKTDGDGTPLQILPENDTGSTSEDEEAITLKDINVITQESNLFNYHPIMGASVDGYSWPRGFPIEHIQDEQTHGKVVASSTTIDLPLISDTKKGGGPGVGIIQFLIDNNSDIDAIHHMITTSKTIHFPLDVDDSDVNIKNSVQVPTHAYAPYNSRATIHTKNALWATLLPRTVHSHVSDIWRSYFAQRIFHDASDDSLQVIVSHPKVARERTSTSTSTSASTSGSSTADKGSNIHDKKEKVKQQIQKYLRDLLVNEQDLYKKSGKLVKFLSEWEYTYHQYYDYDGGRTTRTNSLVDDPCNNSNSNSNDLPERVEQLWIDLYEHGYIELNDVYSMQVWLEALDQIGYEFPSLSSPSQPISSPSLRIRCGDAAATTTEIQMKEKRN